MGLTLWHAYGGDLRVTKTSERILEGIMAFCVQCGSALGEGNAFCTSCGAAVAATSLAVAVTTPAPAADVIPSVAETVVAPSGEMASSAIPSEVAPPVTAASVAAPDFTPEAAQSVPAKTSGGALKIILVVFAIIAVLAAAVIGIGAYYGYGAYQRVQGIRQSMPGASGSSSAAVVLDPCSLATKAEVAEAFGQAIEAAIPHGNKCTYIIANSNNHGITAMVSPGDAGAKFKLAAGGVRAMPVNLATGEPSGGSLGSGEQAAYAYGTFYFFQRNTFVTLNMSGGYGGTDAREKAAAIARKMLPRM